MIAKSNCSVRSIFLVVLYVYNIRGRYGHLLVSVSTSVCGRSGGVITTWWHGAALLLLLLRRRQRRQRLTCY